MSQPLFRNSFATLSRTGQLTSDLTRELVTERLCVSVHNFSPVRSVYRWRGEIYERAEGRASLRTRMSLAGAIVDRVKASHPYEVPGISARPIAARLRDAAGHLMAWSRR
jgi:uncharacterized protein involved in tolerance to divalent cations